MTIAYPSIPIDATDIATAEKILDWICSSGNEPAKSRQEELTELQDLAVNLEVRRTQMPVTGVPNHRSDWLWNTLDMDRDISQSDANARSIILMDQELAANGLSDEAIEQQWFWAGSDGSDLFSQ